MNSENPALFVYILASFWVAKQDSANFTEQSKFIQHFQVTI